MMDIMFQTMLVALDGSPRAPFVLERAVELARIGGGRIHLCRAVTIPIGLPDAVWAMPMAQLDTALVTEAERDMTSAAQPYAAEVVGTHVRIGQAADVIVDIATELSAQLIIIGAHGYGPIERLLGTTASKIVHRAKCSVLVVRG
jgi:universal stress protein A